MEKVFPIASNNQYNINTIAQIIQKHLNNQEINEVFLEVTNTNNSNFDIFLKY